MIKKLFLTLVLVLALVASGWACTLPEGTNIYIFGYGSQVFTVTSDVEVRVMTDAEKQQMEVPEPGEGLTVVIDGAGYILGVPTESLKDCD